MSEMKESNERIYYSIRETARLTGLSEYYLRQRVKRGEIPGINSGVKFLINVPAMLRGLENEH